MRNFHANLILSALAYALFLLAFVVKAEVATESKLNHNDLGQAAKLEKNKIIIVGDDYPPYFYPNSKNEIVGRSIGIINELAKNLDLSVEFQCLTWEECLEKSKNGTAEGIVNLSKNKERENFYYYPKVSLDISEWGVVFLKSNYKGKNVTTVNDLKNKRIGIVKDYLYPEDFANYKDCEKIEAISSQEVISWLIAGKVDFVVEDIEVTKHILKEFEKEQKENLDQVEFMPLIFSLDYLYLGLSKKSPNADELYQRIDKELSRMQNTGEIFKILQKY